MNIEILNWFTEEIRNEFQIPEVQAREFAQNAIDSLEAHGGSSSDKYILRKVMRGVVKSWVENTL